MDKPVLISKEEFKQLARELKEKYGIKSTHAHELLARHLGYKTYNSYLAEIKK